MNDQPENYAKNIDDNPEMTDNIINDDTLVNEVAESDVVEGDIIVDDAVVDEDTPSKFKLLPILLIVLPFITFALGIGIGYLAWGRIDTSALVAQAVEATQSAQPTTSSQAANSENSQTVAAQTTPEPPTELKRYDVPVDDDYVLGPDDAEITIIEFSDYQCPYCKRWYDEVYTQLQELYPGQIRFVYRDFPLTSIHPEAVPAANAANCAGEQGKYYEFHNAVFESKYGLGEEAYLKYAADLGLDTDEFAACVEEERYVDEVMADLDWAANLGVQSTPTFFINGIPLVGAQPLDTFTLVINWELEGKLPKD